jgi:hypothetical protein
VLTEADLADAANGRERGAQLVRGVGREAPKGKERPFEAIQRAVDDGGELAELVLGYQDSRHSENLVPQARAIRH